MTDASADAILKRYLREGKLSVIPSKLSRKMIVLRWLSEMFCDGEAYEEKAVNDILVRVHPDFATLRRDLCDYGLMQRSNGIYRKVRQDESSGAP